jgi:hypothetical protein
MPHTGTLQGICSHCGAGITFQADAIGTSIPCPHCGQPTELTLAPPSYAPTISRTRLILTFSTIALLLVCLAACIAGLWYFEKRKEERKLHSMPAVTNAPAEL